MSQMPNNVTTLAFSSEWTNLQPVA